MGTVVAPITTKPFSTWAGSVVHKAGSRRKEGLASLTSCQGVRSPLSVPKTTCGKNHESHQMRLSYKRWKDPIIDAIVVTLNVPIGAACFIDKGKRSISHIWNLIQVLHPTNRVLEVGINTNCSSEAHWRPKGRGTIDFRNTSRLKTMTDVPSNEICFILLIMQRIGLKLQASSSVVESLEISAIRWVALENRCSTGFSSWRALFLTSINL